MSELMMTRSGHRVRWGLLSTVSAMTLLLSAAAMRAQAEENGDRPNVWIELGGQLERVDGGQTPYTPPFVLTTPRPDFETISPIDTQRLPRYSIGGEGKITFEPENTHWVFSAGIRYGRANGGKKVHQQTVAKPYAVPIGTQITYLTTHVEKFDNIETKHRTSHTILDFKAGQDVGLGLFGGHGKSIFSMGVRYAQFSSKSDVSISSDPDFHLTFVQIPWFPTTFPPVPFAGPHHAYSGAFSGSHNFHAVGPSVSWDASAVIAHSNNDAEIALDWGLNAAVLFGRQKSRTSHHTTGRYYPKYISQYSTNIQYRNPVTPGASINHARSRSVVVPNVGGFAGVSFRYANAKVSLGYRGDFFFGAMDTGIDGRHTSDRNFYGPFAHIRIGLGE